MFEIKWIRISLFNLLLVSFLGLILRYKIVFPLPFVQQKHLLHAHSHFAFSGWVSMIIMTFIVQLIGEVQESDCFKKYKWLLTANLITAYGMLVSFSIQGYAFFSIFFSTLSIIIAYIFGVLVWKDFNSTKTKLLSFKWIKAAIVFNIISSFGAFFLAYLMANKIVHQNWYLASIYFFLHFQYNGWFLFSLGGLITYLLEKNKLVKKQHYYVFYLFVFACIPAYFLSVLWMNISLWLYILVIIATVAQILGWILFLRMSFKNLKNILHHSLIAQLLFLLSAIAFTVKLFLQIGSTIPFLSTLAFGYRPIVIGYLHLVLLGVTTLFLLGYIFQLNLVRFKRIQIKGLFIFLIAVILNEILLMIQGFTAINAVVFPFANEILLGIAFLLFIGLLMLNFK